MTQLRSELPCIRKKQCSQADPVKYHLTHSGTTYYAKNWGKGFHQCHSRSTQEHTVHRWSPHAVHLSPSGYCGPPDALSSFLFRAARTEYFIPPQLPCIYRWFENLYVFGCEDQTLLWLLSYSSFVPFVSCFQ